MLVVLTQEYPRILACQSHRLHRDQSEIHSMKEMITVLHTTQAFIQIIKESENCDLYQNERESDWLSCVLHSSSRRAYWLIQKGQPPKLGGRSSLTLKK